MNRISGKNEVPWISAVIRLALIIGCLIGITFLGANIALAQGKGMKKSPEERIGELKAHLNLTDEQVLAIRPILEQHETQRQEIRNKMAEEMEQLHASTQSRLAEILTDEQVAEYKKIREEKRAKVRDKDERCMERKERRQGAE